MEALLLLSTEDGDVKQPARQTDTDKNKTIKYFFIFVLHLRLGDLLPAFCESDFFGAGLESGFLTGVFPLAGALGGGAV